MLIKASPRTIVLGCSLAVLWASFAFAEPATISGKVTEVFGRRVAIATQDGKVLVNLGPRAVSQVAIKVGDSLTVEGDLRRGDELRARRVSTADGKLYEVNRRKTWAEWLMGREPATGVAFAPEDATRIVEAKGYKLASQLRAEKSHFIAEATKDGSDFEIVIHRDGRVVANRRWTEAQARELAKEKGYEVSGEVKRDKRHFVANATKDGKTYEVDLHRDGRAVERPLITADVARQVATDSGYVVMAGPTPKKKHFEMLAARGAKHYEVHVHPDRSVKQVRVVSKDDPKWGSFVK